MKVEVYESLGDLPDYKQMDKWFHISEIDEEKPSLRHIRQKMQEKIEFAANFVDELLMPDPRSLNSHHESKEITEKDKEKLFEVYKELSTLLRLSNERELFNDADEEIKFVQKTAKKWPDILNNLMPIFNKLHKAWENTKPVKEMVSYLG